MTRTIDTLEFWSSRWGEAAVEQLVDFFPTTDMSTCECAFVVTVNGMLGVLFDAAIIGAV